MKKELRILVPYIYKTVNVKGYENHNVTHEQFRFIDGKKTNEELGEKISQMLFNLSGTIEYISVKHCASLPVYEVIAEVIEDD